jgi:hypothetical protein
MSNIDFKGIAEGFINNTKSNLGVADPKVEELAKKRYETCLQCPVLSDGKKKCDKNKGGCGCSLAWLTRQSRKKCVKGKW